MDNLATPTFTPQTTTNPTQGFLMLQGQQKRVKVNFVNSNGVFYDPVYVNLTIYQPNNQIILNEIYSISSPNVKKAAVGQYYIDFIPDPTIAPGEFNFIWNWKDVNGGEMFTGFQLVAVMPIQLFSLLPNLRSQIDKSQKDTNQIFGYNDTQLYLYIKGAISEINRVPPNTSFSFITYPYGLQTQLLLDVATFVAMTSQALLSIDTDANYSMQGNSMSVDHWAKISSFMNIMLQRMNQSIMHFKLNFQTRIGGVKVERGPGFRQVSIFQAAPSGISFGNILGVR